jgi:dipeptidyl aminopeptidase/acylaminoacyl peptidase
MGVTRKFERVDEASIIIPADSPELRYLGTKITDVLLKVDLANPMTYIHDSMSLILIQHGRMDNLVPVEQSIIFIEKLKKCSSRPV